MKAFKFLILFVSTLLFTYCGEQDNNIADSSTEEKPTATPAATTSDNKGEWVSLFDGETLNGWHVFKDKTSGWKVEDGAITLERVVKGGDLVTDKAYENYELELEWKISDCGNSGIIYNIKEEGYDAIWHTGPEMQVLDNNCHPDAKIKTHRAGDLYDMISVSEETVKPAGEWNKVRLVVNNGHVEHWLNGKKVVEFQMWDDNWKDMVANSKFKSRPDFGTIKKGKIALQDHHDPVWYRNIRIKEL